MSEERKIDDGGPFHPTRDGDKHYGITITLREWLVGMAMQGLLAGGGDYDSRDLANESVQHADNLIRRLKGGAT